MKRSDLDQGRLSRFGAGIPYRKEKLFIENNRLHRAVLLLEKKNVSLPKKCNVAMDSSKVLHVGARALQRSVWR